MESSPSYPDWKAPQGDGEVLIWPAPGQILKETRANLQQLSSAQALSIQRVPLAMLRRTQRKELGHVDDAQPLIATGHQTELIHPGVWAKHALINALATKTGGRAYQFAVDTDGPKHLSLRWPGESIALTDDPNLGRAAWCGLVANPSQAHLDSISERLSSAAKQWGFQPELPAIIALLSKRSAPNLAASIAAANHEFDRSLGLEHQVMLMSPIFGSLPFLAFAHHLMSDAGQFAQVYNGALADFRQAHKTKSPMRPMPDLFVGEQSVEAPFWLDNLTDGTRARPSVFVTDSGFILELLRGERFVFDRSADGFDAAQRLSDWLRATHHRLSPRALSLTMFLRLLVADQFVHGIGGAIYDRISDQIITRYFKLPAAPRFSVSTATMYFPDAVGRPRVCVPCILQDGHRLKHSVLGEKKMEIVREIDSLPRRSIQRQELFSGLHRQRAAALVADAQVARWEQQLRKNEANELEEQTLYDRELYYAIQSRPRLMEMIERYHLAVADE